MKYSWVKGVIKVLLQYEIKNNTWDLKWQLYESECQKNRSISRWKFPKENERMKKKIIITSVLNSTFPRITLDLFNTTYRYHAAEC